MGTRVPRFNIEKRNGIANIVKLGNIESCNRPTKKTLPFVQPSMKKQHLLSHTVRKLEISRLWLEGIARTKVWTNLENYSSQPSANCCDLG